MKMTHGKIGKRHVDEPGKSMCPHSKMTCGITWKGHLAVRTNNAFKNPEATRGSTGKRCVAK